MAAGRIVVLDAGHGQRTGAHVGDLWEDDLNLALARAIDNMWLHRNILGWPTFDGWKPVFTRLHDSYLTLQERCDIANKLNAPVVSIHHNSAPNPKAHGAEAWVYHVTEDRHTVSCRPTPCRDLAWYLLSGLQWAGLDTDRGIRENPRFRILAGTRQPAVILEIGFLTNQGDARLVVKWRPQIAEAIVRGIGEWVRRA